MARPALALLGACLAAGLAAPLDGEVSLAACAPSTTALCLSGNRFRIETRYETLDGRSGSGQAVALTGDTGYFWFFDPANVEVVVKVLSAGCGFNDRYWVFASGLTDVRVTLTATDSVTNETKTYTNPQKTAFEPIQDTNAFGPCGATSCTYGVSPIAPPPIPASGGSGTVTVTAPAGCAWTASSNDSWIRIDSGSSGSGNGTVRYSVASSSIPSTQTGTLTVAGQTVTVTQAAASCQYAVSPLSFQLPASGGTGEVLVRVESGCSWSASASPLFPWIRLTGTGSGSGDGRVPFSVDPNTGGPRDGSLLVAGEFVRVDQAGGGTVDLEMLLTCDFDNPCTVSSTASQKTLLASVRNNGTQLVPAGQATVTLNLDGLVGTQIGAGFAGVGSGWSAPPGSLGLKIVTLTSTVAIQAGQTVSVPITIATPSFGFVEQNTLTASAPADTNPGNDVATFTLTR